MKPTFYSGLLFVIVGLVFLVAATSYNIGVADNMGPGYFPFILGIILCLLGLVNLAKSLSSKEQPLPLDAALRPLFFILVANTAFGLLLPWTGLLIAVFTLVLIASFAMPGQRTIETLSLAVVLSVASFIVFVWALSIPMPVWPKFL